MADFVVDGDDLVLRLRWREKAAGFHADVRVPLAWVRSVRVLADPWPTMRGWRMAGLALTRVFAYGTRRHGTGYDFTIVRGPRPCVQVDLSEGRFQRLVVSAADGAEADAVASRVASAAGIRISEPG